MWRSRRRVADEKFIKSIKFNRQFLNLSIVADCGLRYCWLSGLGAQRLRAGLLYNNILDAKSVCAKPAIS